LTWLHVRGKICVDLAKYDEALEHFHEGMDQFHTNNTDSFSAIFSNQIGVVKYYLAQKREAIKWFIKANDIAKERDMTKLEAFCSNNVGALYTELKVYDSAEVYLHAALDAFDRSGNTNSQAYLVSYRILATNYESMGEIEKSSDMYSKMVNIAEANKDTGALANIYSMLAMQEARLGLKESAFEHAETGLKYYMRDTANLDNVASANEYYSSVHETFDSYEEAYLKLKEASKIRKRMFSNSLSEKVGEMEAAFNTETERQKRALAESETEAAKQQLQLTALVSILLVLGLLGFLFAFRQRQKRKLTEKDILVQKSRIVAVLEGEERERTRIARDLHDGVSQLLSALKMNLSAAGVNDEPSLNLLDQGINEVRNISHNLLPKQLGKGGLIATLENTMSEIGASSSIKTEFTAQVSTLEISTDQQKNIYRITQEVLNNALKHAKANNIACHLKVDNRQLVLSIIDNGVGISLHQIKNSNGIGWKNIMARVEALSGNLEVQPSEKGTHLRFKFPID
jgi:signal transduction histidine kinase